MMSDHSKITQSFSQALEKADLKQKFSPEDYSLQFQDNTFCLTKWQIEYFEALKLQHACLEFVRENAEIKVFIFCSHPPVYTYGRGLQKQKGGVPKEGLVSFSEADEGKLSFPLYKIKRGGGLTFHHSGQFIFYPIINLNKNDWNLGKHFHWLLGTIADSLNSYYQTEEFSYDLCSAGVWREGKKVASVGVGVERFITFHGLALNIVLTEDMEKDLEHLHPCGLKFSQYAAVEKEYSEKLVGFLKKSFF